MSLIPHRSPSETTKRRSLHRRLGVLYAAFFLALLVVVARLAELQILRGAEFRAKAQQQHYGGVILPAKRGEILARDSRTGETHILATNITLDLLYVDPLITDDPAQVARTLATLLLTEGFHAACLQGAPGCPRELIPFYDAAFNPLTRKRILDENPLPEPIPESAPLPAHLLRLPSLVEARDAFAADIARRIAEKRVTFVPLKYGATKTQMKDVQALSVPGVRVVESERLIYANPEEINQSLVDSFARRLGVILEADPVELVQTLRSRDLRYVPVMRKLPRSLSLAVLEAKAASARETLERVKRESRKPQSGEELQYPLRSVALLQEHWRLYPDTTIASHVVGFLNTKKEPQYGVERTFDPQLRGREGRIKTASDPHGGQILRPEQTIEDPHDGDTIILTIDRTVQRELETLLQAALEKFQAESAQAIVMDPFTGRIIAMVNAPLFDSNRYADVSSKESVVILPEKRRQIVVELFHPETNARVVKAYIDSVFTASGRTLLSEKTRKALEELELQYHLGDLTRYYQYVGENVRHEVFPTDDPGTWLKYRNNIGLGAYLNRTVQEIYEPGSVLKPVTMAVAIDQGEVVPEDTYDDSGPVLVDEYKINNNDRRHYGTVTMTNCLEFSINTCMTSVSFRLGAKLFYGVLDRFGFGKISGIELEDELPGEIRPWREWSRTLLATTAFGQGLSATPIQVITAWSALANGGRLMRPVIIDAIVREDGTEERMQPKVMEQVITAKTSETITAMLVSAAAKGFAKAGKVPGYRIAAKTGTSQIAGPGGKYETGTGSTIATFAGYAPINRPRFVILVKVDRPKSVIHGATAAAPVFKDIAAFLFKYYGIPPDEK